MRRIDRRSFLYAIAAGAAFSVPVCRAAAQSYPDHPVRVIVPFTAGGASDTLARILSELLRDALGQPFVVENRPGGNSVIGMLATANAPPDGHSMVAGHIGTHAITPAISPPSGYDPAKAFATIAVHASSSNLLVVRADSKIDTFKSLIDLAKSKPGALNYGSPGVGSPSHIAVVKLAAMTGINVVHVAYRGNSAALTDMLTGTLDFMFASPAEVLEHVRAGKLKALAASGAQRSTTTPDIVPVAELGVPGFDFRTWHAVSVRADTPPAIIGKLSRTFTDIMATSTYRKRLSDLSIDAGMGDGEEADKFVQAEIAFWAKFVKDAGIRPD